MSSGAAAAEMRGRISQLHVIVCFVTRAYEDTHWRSADACSSGAGGGGTKGPSSIDKRLQEQKCPFCERVFKQVAQRARRMSCMHGATHMRERPLFQTSSPGPGVTSAATACSPIGTRSTSRTSMPRRPRQRAAAVTPQQPSSRCAAVTGRKLV
jgi:hypothetical protein